MEVIRYAITFHNHEQQNVHLQIWERAQKVTALPCGLREVSKLSLEDRIAALVRGHGAFVEDAEDDWELVLHSKLFATIFPLSENSDSVMAWAIREVGLREKTEQLDECENTSYLSYELREDVACPSVTFIFVKLVGLCARVSGISGIHSLSLHYLLESENLPRVKRVPKTDDSMRRHDKEANMLVEVIELESKLMSDPSVDRNLIMDRLDQLKRNASLCVRQLLPSYGDQLKEFKAHLEKCYQRRLNDANQD